MPNTIAIKVLAEYLSVPEPRYALLINAPWGAGKTEFIKKHTQYETDQNLLYLSLFGIDSVDAFNEAMLAAILKNPDRKFRKKVLSWAESLKNVASTIQAVGFSINLSSFSLLEGLRKDLPKILIFDDLERVSMPQLTMSGILNKFIEHDKRHVILIANTEEIREDEKRAFDTTREKRIGRTIQISPDIDAALQSYWVSIPTGSGTTYLQENQDLIKTVFSQGGHGNLRLLRYALEAVANLLNKIDDPLFNFKSSMKKLTGTFLALHMAYGGGRITKANLLCRSDSRAFGIDLFGKQKPDGQVKALIDLAAAHPEFDIRIPFNGSPLSSDLVTTLLIEGYASANNINKQLRQNHHFIQVEEHPDWIRLWNWGELNAVDLSKVLKRLDARLVANEVDNPGEFVQIYGAMHFLSKFGGIDQNQVELSETFLNYIRSMAHADKIRPRNPSGRARERYVFGYEMGSVNYGGYVFEPDDISNKVIDAMMTAMDKAYDDSLADVASSLLTQFESSTDDFMEQISFIHNSPNYAFAPVLHLMDEVRFADRLFHLIENDRELAVLVADEIKTRRQNHRNELVEEHKWIDAMKSALLERATATSPLDKARVELFISRTLEP